MDQLHRCASRNTTRTHYARKHHLCQRTLWLNLARKLLKLTQSISPQSQSDSSRQNTLHPWSASAFVAETDDAKAAAMARTYAEEKRIVYEMVMRSDWSVSKKTSCSYTMLE
jgi:hypothetical protein